MSIIYSYPIKGTPANDDLILISDSASSPQFATKQIKVSSLPGGSASGVSSFNTLTGAVTITGGTNVTLNPVGNNIEINAAGGGGTPSTPLNSVQFNNASAFGGSDNLTFTTNTLAVTHTVDIKGDGVNAGKLKLYCENTSTPHAVTIEGPAHSGAAAYTLKLPSPAPASNQVLEYENSTNNLRWINTPTGGGSPAGSDTQIQYNNGGAFGGATGLTWNDSTNILSIGTRFEGDIDGALLQQVVVKEVGGVSKGDIVYISGGTGDNPEVKKAQANASITMPALGIMKANTAENAIGECVTSGEITGLNLTGFTTGDELFVSSTTAGGFQTSAPTGEANLIQKIGKVIRGGTGGALTVLGAFRTNATPNLNQGSLFIGNASNQATTLGIGGNNTVLKSNGTTATWATPTDTNTNIANSNLQLDNNRTLDFNNDATARSLTFINTNGGSKNLFKFEQTGGTAPYFYVGHTESAYEGYVVLEGNGSNRTGQVQFENAAGTYYTSIKAPNTFGANQNIVYVLPNLQGAANSVLTNNGSGTLSWGSAAIVEEGTWTPSAYVPTGSAPTLTTAVGSYIKIGDLVNCYFYLNVTSSSSANVAMIIASLPFSASNTNGYRGTVSISRNDGTNFIQQQATSGLVSGNQAALKRLDIASTTTETINASWFASASLNYILEGTIIFKI